MADTGGVVKFIRWRDWRWWLDLIGLIGLVTLMLAILINNDVLPREGFWKTAYWRFLAIGILCFIAHFSYLAMIAIERKQYVWAIVLFIAPIPVYWIYYAFESFYLRARDKRLVSQLDH